MFENGEKVYTLKRRDSFVLNKLAVTIIKHNPPRCNTVVDTKHSTTCSAYKLLPAGLHDMVLALDNILTGLKTVTLLWCYVIGLPVPKLIILPKFWWSCEEDLVGLIGCIFMWSHPCHLWWLHWQVVKERERERQREEREREREKKQGYTGAVELSVSLFQSTVKCR